MKLSQKQAEALQLLATKKAKYVLRRSNTLHLHGNNKPTLYGTHLVNIINDQEISMQKLHGNVINPLITSGILVASKYEPQLEHAGFLYELSNDAQSIALKLIAHARQTTKKRITLDVVNKIAAKFGAYVGHIKSRKLFYVVRLSAPNGKRAYIGTTSDGDQAVTKLSDLSADEWQDAIIDCLKNM